MISNNNQKFLELSGFSNLNMKTQWLLRVFLHVVWTMFTRKQLFFAHFLASSIHWHQIKNSKQDFLPAFLSFHCFFSIWSATIPQLIAISEQFEIFFTELRIYFIFVRNDGRFRTYKKYIFLALKSLKNEVKLKLIAAKLIGDSYTLLKIINYYFESKNFKNVKMVTNFWLPVLRGKHVFFFN